MAIKLAKIHYVHIDRTQLPDDPEQWLVSLQSGVVIDVEGQDTNRTRVVSVLVHGNEPSGFYAVHRWLKGNETPICNVRFIISAVEAAQQPPYFTTRYLNDIHDLNRCFSLKVEDQAVKLRAASILQAISEVHPEAVIDMHNTSGSSPAFCVTTRIEMPYQALASFFCQSVIYTRLQLGSLMEQDFGCPIVTVECGGSQDQLAHEMAYQGLHEFLQAENLFAGHHYKLVDIIEHPLRLEIDKNIKLVFAEHKDESADVTLVSDIEQHNMGKTRADCFLGWSKLGIEPFTVRNEAGEVQSDNILYCQDGKLYTAHSLRIFMATSNRRIAQNDCLFYAFCTE
ncbi:succinylglutamate desuccinylase/aspartoacylase domain-containing protein [Catenovulum sediminis]|uniref:Succinylglutamate desuccinylase/aspartoacylase family protein n=1 Tax=Catenovulum sediminis TaxID=1740262 RepID=A0ABV1RCC0_9ALTE|nr:succinylglutamate desuccinylase/aspartoacylase family protein [Catenovulum sediminis]